MGQKQLGRGLMTQFPVGRTRAFVCKNIGDYVQSVASSQFVGDDFEFIEQEEADFYKSKNGRKTRLIMNGWFQWRTENWPPSDDILPLLVSMHFSPLKKDQLLTPKGIEFLKKNGPVGCRDHYTESLLKSYDIPAYFSSCVTLTMGKKYKVEDNQREGYYFVDPYIEIPPLYEEQEGKHVINEERLNNFINLYSKHSEIIDNLASRSFFKEYLPTGFLDRDENFYRPFYKAACFYKTYSKKFTDELIINAEYITHWMDVDMSSDTTETLLEIAENLVKKYARAKMLVTSRIHAGLPSLGMNTPVVFIANPEVTSESGNFNTPGRLGGLLELFRILNLENDVFSTDDEEFLKIEKFGLNTFFENKKDWQPYARRLDKQLSMFMGNDFEEDQIANVRNIPAV